MKKQYYYLAILIFVIILICSYMIIKTENFIANPCIDICKKDCGDNSINSEEYGKCFYSCRKKRCGIKTN